MNSDLITSSDLSGGAELAWVDDVFRKQIDHNLSAMILPGKHDTLHCYIIRIFPSFIYILLCPYYIGLNRKEFGKFLASDQRQVGSAMVGYMGAILDRLLRLLSAAEVDPSSQRTQMALSFCLQTYFPDINAFVQYWNR